MFKKVLIANRGEIALRIMRTCARLGVRGAVVYSDADRDALHVRRADEAVRIGPARPAASYLNVAAVIDAARSAGADALHPGYGFLSEDPALPEACAAAGIHFIGPGAAAMRLLGDKTAARRLAAAQGVPVVPGCDIDAAGDGAAAAAQAVGYPLLIKAAAGGGGRGMRLVESPERLPEALASARREAAAAFGDDRVFIERAIEGARHVEVQVLADAHGHALHLGDRDCSVQRRHQKVIEESPAPGLSGGLRGKLGAAALAVARAAGYVNAGTVEFLVDDGGRFYFLEVNARLQVEHPVTEMVCGLDLVEWQLRIAAGEPLTFAQEDVRVAGHAIECRICAEDPERGYAPSSGRVTSFMPPSGEGVRVDSGVESGSLVPPEYDSLIAKLVVHAPSRGEALEKCRRALAAFAVEGVKTNLGLLDAVMAHPAFATGAYDLSLLESMPPESFAPALPGDVLLAAVAHDVGPFEAVRGHDPWRSLGAWRGGATSRLEYVYHGRRFAATAERVLAHSDAWRVTFGGRTHEIEINAGASGEVVVRTAGSDTAWHVQGDARRLSLESRGWRYVLTRPTPSTAGIPSRAGAGHTGEMRAPIPGVVARVLVAEGEHVVARQPLVMLEAMKIEHIIHSTVDGVVRRLRCRDGQRVAEGEILVEVETVVEDDATS